MNSTTKLLHASCLGLCATFTLTANGEMLPPGASTINQSAITTVEVTNNSQQEVKTQAEPANIDLEKEILKQTDFIGMARNKANRQRIQNSEKLLTSEKPSSLELELLEHHTNAN